MIECIWPIFDNLGRWLAVNLPAGMAALFGTFFGAWFAFQFERKHQEKGVAEAQVSAGRQSQFALITQLNAMKNIKKQYLSSLETDPDRHLRLVPFQVLVDLPKLPLKELAFFLGDDGAQILNEAMLAEHRFFTFVGALTQRNQRHEAMQGRIVQIGPEAAIDQATSAILKDMTDSLYGLSDDIVKHHKASIERMGDYLKKRFPGKQVVNFSADE